jgi:hypothetical protein
VWKERAREEALHCGGRMGWMWRFGLGVSFTLTLGFHVIISPGDSLESMENRVPISEARHGIY